MDPQKNTTNPSPFAGNEPAATPQQNPSSQEVTVSLNQDVPAAGQPAGPALNPTFGAQQTPAGGGFDTASIASDAPAAGLGGGPSPAQPTPDAGFNAPAPAAGFDASQPASTLGAPMDPQAGQSSDMPQNPSFGAPASADPLAGANQGQPVPNPAFGPAPNPTFGGQPQDTPVQPAFGQQPPPALGSEQAGIPQTVPVGGKSGDKRTVLILMGVALVLIVAIALLIFL